MIQATIQAGLVVTRVIDMYSLLRRALFTLDAEVAHERTAALLKLACQTPGASAVLRQLFAPATRGLGQTVAGLTFAIPSGWQLASINTPT